MCEPVRAAKVVRTLGEALLHLFKGRLRKSSLQSVERRPKLQKEALVVFVVTVEVISGETQ
jgi:hypothetical protein